MCSNSIDGEHKKGGPCTAKPKFVIDKAHDFGYLPFPGKPTTELTSANSKPGEIAKSTLKAADELRKMASLAELDRQLARYKEKSERNAAVAELDRQLAELDHDLAEVDHQLAELDRQLAREKAKAERDRDLEVHCELAELDRRLERQKENLERTGDISAIDLDAAEITDPTTITDEELLNQLQHHDGLVRWQLLRASGLMYIQITHCPRHASRLSASRRGGIVLIPSTIAEEPEDE